MSADPLKRTPIHLKHLSRVVTIARTADQPCRAHTAALVAPARCRVDHRCGMPGCRDSTAPSSLRRLGCPIRLSFRRSIGLGHCQMPSRRTQWARTRSREARPTRTSAPHSNAARDLPNTEITHHGGFALHKAAENGRTLMMNGTL